MWVFVFVLVFVFLFVFFFFFFFVFFLVPVVTSGQEGLILRVRLMGRDWDARQERTAGERARQEQPRAGERGYPPVSLHCGFCGCAHRSFRSFRIPGRSAFAWRAREWPPGPGDSAR
ncbi:MAG: hypothetical protein E7458_07270 [Ruminococcaceae bacterium]|nr:hypothetical protein [Oscillospiraceae bacterium]